MRVAGRIKLTHILLAGVFCQFAVAIITAPILVSDPRTYLVLAERLAGGMEYVDGSGHRAFWPPGLPLYLHRLCLFLVQVWLPWLPQMSRYTSLELLRLGIWEEGYLTTA